MKIEKTLTYLHDALAGRVENYRAFAITFITFAIDDAEVVIFSQFT